MSREVGEWYLRHDDVARRLGNMEPRDVIDAIKAREFGDRVIHRGRYYYIPESAYNEFCRSHRVFDDSTGELKPIYARNVEELDRKITRLKGAGS